MATPLPPRPKTETNDQEPKQEYLSENTLAEQQAGRENAKLANKKLEEEMELGKQIVEQNKQRRAKK